MGISSRVLAPVEVGEAISGNQSNSKSQIGKVGAWSNNLQD